MRASLPTFLLALLAVPALAGCLDAGGPESTDAADAADVDLDALPGHVRAFVPAAPGLNGTRLVPLPDGFVPGVADFTYLGRYGPEPNVGATSSGALFVSAFSDVMRSTDGGLNWEVVQTHQPADVNNDPMLWVDPVTDRVYNAPMAPTLLCAAVYWSDSDGDAWTPAPAPACGTGAFDHQKFATGLPGPDDNPLAGVLWPTVAYLCYNGVAVTNCMVSYDGGQTWPVDQPTAANVAGTAASLFGVEATPAQVSPCFTGQNGHPAAGPDGTVAFLRTWSCIQPMLTYSTDSGLTWTNVPGPEFPGGPSDFLTTANAHSIDPEVAWTPDGTLYTLFQSHDHRAYLARTTDLGATWDGPWDVTPPGVDSTVFAAMAAGSDGRLAMAFLGAANVTGSSTNAPADARWHMQVVTTETADADAPLFVAYQATPDSDPVQVGPILQGGGVDNTRNLLDFIDGTVDPDGHFYVSFTVGCTRNNGCADLPAEEQTSAYRASEGAVAYLKGWSLYTDE